MIELDIYLDPTWTAAGEAVTLGVPGSVLTYAVAIHLLETGDLD